MSEQAHVRYSASVESVDIEEFDPVPCRMRLSAPGKSRLIHPVPGRPDGVDRNTDILVWCECMAQTWDQLRMARAVIRAGMDPADVAWPVPKQTRGWDVLGAISTVLLETKAAASSRARKANPNSTKEALAMWHEHVQSRALLISQRSAA